MRRLFVFAFALAIMATATARAGDLPRGVYASVAAADSADCARICADDTLCVSWSFQSGNDTCALRATRPAGPAPVALAAAASYAEAAPITAPMEPAARPQAQEVQESLLGGPESAEGSVETPQPLADLRSR